MDLNFDATTKLKGLSFKELHPRQLYSLLSLECYLCGGRGYRYSRKIITKEKHLTGFFYRNYVVFRYVL